MPQKLGKGGAGPQNYVPPGNPAGGQYGDNETGSNKHYFAHFAKQPTLKMNGDNSLVSKFKNKKKFKNVSQIFDEAHKLKDKLNDNYTNQETGEIENVDELDKLFNEIDEIVDDKVIEFTGGFIEDNEIEEFLNDDLDKPIENVDKPVKAIKPKIQKDIQKLDDTDCYDYLLGFEGEFDENKIKNLSSDDLHNLVTAKQNLEINKKKDFVKKVNEDLSKELKPYEGIGQGYIWKKVPEDIDALKKSLGEKEKFYNEVEENVSNNWLESDSKTTMLENIAKNKKDLQNIKENIIDKYDKLTQEAKEKQENYDAIIKNSEELVDKYTNPDNVYSQKAKDNAIWFKSIHEAKDYLTPIAKETYKTINPDDLEKVIEYTQSYSFINEPLRNQTYIGSSIKQQQFFDYVKGMTNAIDKSVLKENMWVQRGVDSLNINGLNISNYNLDDLNGVVFEDQGFLSCGAAKGTGFTSNNVIMNIYCPKGTKALYVNPISHFSGENEMIIQRGYSFKITKVEKNGWKTYLDCEVILNSDSKKYDDKKLKELQEKKFK